MNAFARSIGLALIVSLVAACDDDPAGATPGFTGRWSLTQVADIEMPLLVFSGPASGIPGIDPPECPVGELLVDVWLEGAALTLDTGGDTEAEAFTRYDATCGITIPIAGDTLRSTGSWTARGDEIDIVVMDSIPLSPTVWIGGDDATWTGFLMGEERLDVHVDAGYVTILLQFERD